MLLHGDGKREFQAKKDIGENAFEMIDGYTEENDGIRYAIFGIHDWIQTNSNTKLY